MVPSAFVLLEALPLTPNGKIDRRALPAPQHAMSAHAAFVAPRTPVEEVLAGIWAQLLHLPQVSIHDNFFALGGHSLLATRLLSQLRTALQVELPLRSLFEAPTVVGLAAHVERAAQQADGRTSQSIQPVARQSEFPLSFAQRRLWFLSQLEPASPAYHLPIVIRLRGHVQVAALEQALQAIVQRHEVLRTTYVTVNGQSVQMIGPVAPVQFPTVDLRTRAAPGRHAALLELAEAEARRPFDLTHGPVLRATLVLLDEAEQVLLLTLHHIAADGWSLGICFRDLAAFYSAAAGGPVVALPALPIQYADFAAWQQDWLQGPQLEANLAYWGERLAGAPVLEIPTDRPRPAIQTFSGARHLLALPAELLDLAHTVSRTAGTTLFMTLLAIFQALLARYSGQYDIVVGTPIAGRTRAEIENLIGCFVNTLVLRTELAAGTTFEELLRRVREVALGAYAHQDLPIERLVEVLQPERDLSRSPLFQVMFILQNAGLPEVQMPGLAVEQLQLGRTSAKFDLSLELFESQDGLRGWFEYNTDLFDAATVARMAGHFETLMRALLARPDQPIATAPLLTSAEQQLFSVWNATETAYPSVESLHALCEAQAARTPDSVALAYEGHQLTYAELNRRANQLAHHLRALGVGPDVPVGICVERSLEMVVGLLGILKAGGAYVPLDPTYPPDRLAFMLADARPTVVLTATTDDRPGTIEDTTNAQRTTHNAQRTTHNALPALAGGRWSVVELVADWPQIARHEQTNPGWRQDPQSLAYIIYTSGSTGRPKGAMNTHRAICNRLLWMQDAYALTADDRVLQKTPFSFDVSVWEFFWPLMTGAQLVLARPEGHKDSAYMAGLIAEQQVTTVHFVPSMLQFFVEEPDAARCTSLRRVICSGEALPFELQERTFARLPQAALHNLYGPTEAAVDVTFWACERDSELRRVPIGRPIANIQLYILDAALQPVPVGVSGELYLGGIGLARGYWQRPDLTAERFVPNPFEAPPGTRLYKTGDLARYLPDGAVEYLGRIDHQVKLRGFRIELDEIAAHLVEHAAVREAVVVARAARSGDMRLIAYVVPATSDRAHSTDQTVIREVRSFLQDRLPDYMIPAVFVALEALPLSPNGKVDRRALPGPAREQTRPEANYRPPRTELERMISAVWQEVLQIERIGLEDNFFDLGGHSLLLVQVRNRLRDLGGRDIPMLDLFRYPTISALTGYLGQLDAPPAPAEPADTLAKKIEDGQKRLQQLRRRRLVEVQDE